MYARRKIFCLPPHSKTCTMTSMNAQALRVFLVGFLVVMYVLSVIYLSRRKMSVPAYAFWGIFALLLPAFGPFFVIAYRPGEMTSRKRSKPGVRSEHSRNVQT